MSCHASYDVVTSLVLIARIFSSDGLWFVVLAAFLTSLAFLRPSTCVCDIALASGFLSRVERPTASFTLPFCGLRSALDPIPGCLRVPCPRTKYRNQRARLLAAVVV